MSDTADRDEDDGIRTEDLGYGDGAEPQHAGGLGAALPDIGGPPTGTGAEVTDAVDDAGLGTLPEGSGTPSTRQTNNTSGSPVDNDAG